MNHPDSVRTDTIIKETGSVCSRCLERVPALVVEREGKVILEKTCAEHGVERALLASDPAFYYKRPKEGCSGGSCCGPSGDSSCSLIFEVTEGCNLTCPTCFSNSSPERGWKLGLDALDAQLVQLMAPDACSGKQRNVDIVQLSGGEPTTHPDIEAMIELCFERGVKKVYLNSNGLRLAGDKPFVERLAQYTDRLQVYLQFDGFKSETYAAIRGAKGLATTKLRALDALLESGIYTLPVMTVTRGINLDEVGSLIRMALERHPRLTGVMLQPAMYAGRYLGDRPDNRVTVAELAEEVERQTEGMFSRADFGPIPCADPNCFSMAVGLVQDKRVIPISRYFPAYESWQEPAIAERIERFADRLPQHMVDSLEDDALVDQLLDLFSGDGVDQSQLGNYSSFFIIGIKPFMDAVSYDEQRVEACCTHVVDRSGTPVSLCEYNVLRRPRGLA